MARSSLLTPEVPHTVIFEADDRPSLPEELRELGRYRQLIGILVRREIRLRYKNSVLGFLWSLVPLLLQVLVLSVVVKFIYGVAPRNLTAYILCAYLPWNFLQNGLLDSASSLLAQGGLLKKVYFPREIFPIAAVLGNGVHLLLALGVFFAYRYLLTPVLYGWPGLPPHEFFLLPFLLLINFLLVMGLSFFLAAWNVFHEDIKFIAQTLLNLVFFAMPVAWFPEQILYSPHIPAALRHPLTILCNVDPVSWLISAYRQVLLGRADIGPDRPLPTGVVEHTVILTGPFDYRYFALAAVTSLLTALAGYHYFNRRKWQFVERP